MVKLKKRKRPEPEIPTASMSDISFLLLLFFLVSTVIDVDTGIGIVLPEYVENRKQCRSQKIDSRQFWLMKMAMFCLTTK
jgi:biopolymer transport protein ExbD